MRKIFLLIFSALSLQIFAQSFGDGCMNVRFVATQAYNQEYEDPFFNDESNWQWWFADAGNYDGAGWSGGQCLAQGGFFQIGWWNHADYTVYNHQYGAVGPNATTVPVYYSLRGAYEGDDCGGSCDSNTGCLFDSDDYLYDETVANFINYRFGPPNSNNYFQVVTTNHGSSDFGGQFYTRYTSPRPLVSASTTQICSGNNTNVTLNFSGAIFGGNYVVYDGGTIIYNGTSSSTTVSINSSKTYNVYTSNGGVRSQCYSTITINAVNCDFNCVTNANITWNGSYDWSQGVSPGTSFSSPGDFPTNSYISDINVDINFLKTDGSCAAPTGGSAYHNETHFRLDNSTLGSISLVDGNFSGNTSLTTAITMTFDEDATTGVSGYNVTPASNGAVLDPIGNLDAWNWNIINPAQTWRLWGGDDVNLDPLCTNFYNLTVCGCKTANYGTAFVNGSSSAITICEDDPGTITLTHNGSSTGFDNQGYGDELRWFSGSCGGSFVGSGMSVSIPSPTVTTTYYASFYIDGVPCRGANSYCESIQVVVNASPVSGTITPAAQTLCEGNYTPQFITLTGYSGSVAGWEYSSDGGGTWSNTFAAATPTFAINPYTNNPGVHTFRALVYNGVCDTIPSAVAQLTINPEPDAGTINAPQTNICSDTAFVINANGYTGSIQWQVSTVNGTSGFTNIAGQNSPSFGTSITNNTTSPITRWYRVTATNAPCSTTDISNVIAISIAPQTNPGSVSGLTDTICAGGNPGNLSLTGHVGSVQNWLVSFNGGANSSIANTNTSYNPGTLNTPGLYTYSAVVQSGACDAATSASFSVRVLPSVTASVSGLTEVCEAQSITLTATASGGNGTYAYQWQRNGVNVGTNSPSLTTSTSLSAGVYNYTVIVTSGPCSTTSGVFPVTVHPRPVYSNVTTQNLACYGVNIGQINIIASADSFSIDNGASFSASNTFTGLAAGNYNLVVKNLFGCETSYSANPVVITQPDSTSISFNITEPNCATSNDGAIQVNATGGTPGYEYALNGGSYQSGNVFSSLAPGVYTVSVRDNNNCVYSKDTTLTALYTFDLVIDSLKDVSCPGSADGYIELGTVGGVSPFTFSTDNVIYNSDSVYNGLVAGSYTFYALDVNGCSDVVAATVIESPPIQVQLDSLINITCAGANDASVYITLSGSTTPYQTVWTRNGTFFSNSEDLMNIGPGSYNLTVTTSPSCIENFAINITEPNVLAATITNTNNVTCNGLSNGGLQASITGGTPGYTYVWTDALSTTVGTNQNLSGIGAGTYTLTVTDANGCVTTTSGSVAQPASIAVVAVVTNPSCANSNNGDITVAASGGTAPFSYSLNGGASQPGNIFSGLAAGSYTITVTDANGCTGTGNAILTNLYSLSLAVQSQTNVSCAGQNDGTVTLQATGGQAPLSYSINGGVGQASNVFTGLAPGLYNFEVVDVNGCSAITSTTITSNPPLSFTLDSITNVACNGQSTGAIYVSATGGSSPLSYSLNGGAGQATGSFTGLAAGSYTVTVTDPNGCTENISATVSQPSALSASVTATSNVTCNGLSNGSIQVSVTGGTPAYTYVWTDALSATVGTSQNLSGVGSGTYTLTVTDANGCVTSTSASITQPASIAVVAVVTNPSCGNSNNGDITVAASGGTPPYSYSLNGGSNQPSNVFSGLAAGSFTITVTDANGCTGIGNAILTNQYSLSLAVQSQTNVSCAGQNDGTVTVQETGGQGPFSYSINGGAGQASNVFTGLAPGLYNFEVVDVNGCSATVSTTITSNPPLSFTLDSVTNVACNGQSTGAIYVSATGGSSPLSYSLNGGAGQATGSFTGLAAGSYTVTVTDPNGCTENISATVAQPSALSASVTGTSNVTCNGLSNGSIQVSVTGGTPTYTYVWTDALSATVGTSQNLSGVGSGTYTLTVTDANGCVTSTSASITQPSAISVVAVVSNPSCANSNDGEITVAASGGTAPFSYSLNGGSNQPSNVFSGLAAGSFTITVTDANGCTGTGNAILTNQYSLSLAVQSQTNVSCAGQNDGTVTLQETGGQAPFSYSINGGAGQASNVFTGLAPGLYNFEVVDVNGCSATVSTTITSNPPLSFTLDSITNVACNGQSTGAIYVSATGGSSPLSYSLNGGVGQATGSFTGLAAGSYTVTVTDPNGCTENISATVAQPSALSASVTGTTNVTCSGFSNGSVQVSVTGGTPSYNYVWTDALNTTVATSQNLSGVSAGTYTLTVTDANGCIDSVTAVITVPSPISVVAVVSNPSCSNSNDGEITVAASGGTAPYTYSLNGGANQPSNVFSGLAAGSYTIIVTDANGCTGNGNAILTNQYSLSLAVQSQTNVSCAGQNDGTVTVQETGGQGPFSYSINGGAGQASNVFTGLAPGLYNFEVVDVNGCSATTSTTITSNPPLSFTLDSVTNVACNGQSTGAIYVSATGGSSPLSYSLNGGAGQATGSFTGLAAGSYTVTVTDPNGCTENISATVAQPSALSVSVTGTANVTCSGLSNGSIQANVTGGTPSYSYAWTDALNATVGTGLNLTGIGAGTYTLTVTDANGCIDSVSASITDPAAISVVTVVSNPSCANSNDGEISVAASGGTAPYTYSLNGGSNQPSNVFSGLAAGSFTITVTDANGCTGTGNAILTYQYSLSLAVQSQTNVSCAGQNDGTVTLQETGGQAPFSYSINGGAGQASNVFTGLAPGLYNFEVVDVNGCSATVSTTITSNPPLSFTLDSVTNVACNGQSTGAIYVSATGGSSPLSYSLNGGAGQATGSFTGLAAGSYTVTVTDPNGCTENISATVAQPSALSASVIGTTDASCNGFSDGSVQANVTGGTPSYTYEWTDATSAVVGTGLNLAGVGAGTYTLTVTDANGCITSTVANVSEPTALSFTTNDVDPSCANTSNGSITVNASGGTAPYFYSLNNGPIQTSNVFAGLAAGTYSVLVEDNNACVQTASVTLTNQYVLSLAVQSQTNVSCAGQNDGTVTLQTSGGQTPFGYSVNGGASQASNVFTGLAPGLYNFEVVDVNGCSATTTATITSNPPLNFTLDSVSNVACNGQSTGAIYVSASGGSGTYTFSLNGGTAQASGSFTGLAAGNYTITVTDANACSESISATISEPSALALVVANFSDVLCAGDSTGYVDLSVGGGTPPYAFSWSDGSSNIGVTEDAYNLWPGTFSVTVTDVNGCVATISQLVQSPAPLAGSISTTDEQCFGDQQGTAVANVSGGTLPYTYLWSTFENTDSISGLGGGLISVLVTDVNGCQITLFDTIGGPQQALEIELLKITTVTCFGGNDGEIETAITGGTPPYDIVWTPTGDTTSIISNLTAGSYTITVTDANGCVVSSTFTVTEPPLIVSSVSVTNPTCFGQETGAALVGASGGTPPFTYEWNTSPVQSGVIANNLAGDTSYVVSITDNLGCVVYDTAVLVYPAPMDVTVTAQGVTCVANDNGEVAVIVTGGNAPYTYQLNGLIQTDSIFDNLAVGTYVVFVVDNNNCNASTQFDIVQNPVLEIELLGAGNDGVYWSEDLFIIRGEEVDLLLEVLSSGIPVADAQWSAVTSANLDTTLCGTPCFEPTMMPEESLVVTVSAIDTNGCVVTDTLNVNVSQEPVFFMPTAFSPNGDCLNDYFEINVLGGTSLDVRIFNRWGEELFHNPNQANGLSNPLDMEAECLSGLINPRNAWDGTFNGEPMPNGAYTYQIDVTMFDGSVQTMSGTVTILR